MHDDLIARLREHDDQRLYREADELMAEAADALEAMQAALKIARGALADISVSDDMTLDIARRKADRIYNETDPGDASAPSQTPPATEKK